MDFERETARSLGTHLLQQKAQSAIIRRVALIGANMTVAMRIPDHSVLPVGVVPSSGSVTSPVIVPSSVSISPPLVVPSSAPVTSSLDERPPLSVTPRPVGTCPLVAYPPLISEVKVVVPVSS